MDVHAACDIAIVGSGPVGLFTVFQAGMLGMTSCVMDSLDVKGGQCAVLYPEKPIYDIPGFCNITAQDLVNNLIQQAAPFKPQYILGQTVELIREHDHSFFLTKKRYRVAVHRKRHGNTMQSVAKNIIIHAVKDPL